MAEGDLTQSVQVKNRDEVGDLAQAFNHMTGKLNSMMRQVLESSGHRGKLQRGDLLQRQQLASGARIRPPPWRRPAPPSKSCPHPWRQVSSTPSPQAGLRGAVGKLDASAAVHRGAGLASLTTVSKAAREAMEKAREGRTP